jgi:hypothetical protein
MASVLISAIGNKLLVKPEKALAGKQSEIRTYCAGYSDKVHTAKCLRYQQPKKWEF